MSNRGDGRQRPPQADASVARHIGVWAAAAIVLVSALSFGEGARADAEACPAFRAGPPSSIGVPDAAYAPGQAGPAAVAEPPYGPASRAYHFARADEAKRLHDEILGILAREPFERPEVAARYAGRPVLSIVIPAYREERRLPRSIQLLREFVELYPLDVQVIVVAEHSPDDTHGAAMAAIDGHPQMRVHRNLDGLGRPLRGGKGFAVRTGMGEADGRFALFMDADLSTNLAEILRFLRVMLEPDGPQVLIGNRASEEIQSARSWPRRVMTRGLAGLRQLTGNGDFADSQAGFKMFTLEAQRAIFAHQRQNGFEFDLEVLALARALNLRVQDLPIEWIDAVAGSTVRPVRDAWRMGQALIRVPIGTFFMNRGLHRGPEPEPDAAEPRQ